MGAFRLQHLAGSQNDHESSPEAPSELSSRVRLPGKGTYKPGVCPEGSSCPISQAWRPPKTSVRALLGRFLGYQAIHGGGAAGGHGPKRATEFPGTGLAPREVGG